MDLVEFLKARIADDEQVARELDRVGDWSGLCWRGNDDFGARDDDGAWSAAADCFDAARLLREVAAKRKILDEHRHYNAGNYGGPLLDPSQRFGCQLCSCVDDDPGWHLEGGYCITLRAIAAVYSDHPSYDNSWGMP